MSGETTTYNMVTSVVDNPVKYMRYDSLPPGIISIVIGKPTDAIADMYDVIMRSSFSAECNDGIDYDEQLHLILSTIKGNQSYFLCVGFKSLLQKKEITMALLLNRTDVSFDLSDVVFNEIMTEIYCGSQDELDGDVII